MAFQNVYRIILSSIVMISPILPFISEDSYQRFFRKYEGMRSIFDLSFPEEMEFDAGEAETGELTANVISMARDLKVKQRIPLSEKVSRVGIISKGIVIDERDVMGSLKAERVSFEQGEINERIVSVKLRPEIYQSLRGKAAQLEEMLRERPDLIEHGMEFEGIKIVKDDLTVIREYSVKGREARCSDNFCVTLEK